MGAASTLALICALWYSRVQHAKIYDPRRPIELRQQAYWRWRRWQHALKDAVLDESRDHLYFPEQEWDPPFAPDARDGDFV